VQPGECGQNTECIHTGARGSVPTGRLYGVPDGLPGPWNLIGQIEAVDGPDIEYGIETFANEIGL